MTMATSVGEPGRSACEVGPDASGSAGSGSAGSGSAGSGSRCLVARAVARLLGVDLAVASRGAVESALIDAAYVRRWLDGVELRAAQRLASLAEDTSGIVPEQVIATATRTDIRHGARAVERASTAAQFGAVARAADDGRVSSAHVDVLTGALAGLPAHLRPALAARDDRLAEVAGRTTPAQFRRAVHDEARRLENDDGVARLVRQRRLVGLKTWLDQNSGMIRLAGQFDPETGLALVARLEGEIEARFHRAVPDDCPSDPGLRNDFLRAHALLALIAPRPPVAPSPDADQADPPSGEAGDGYPADSSSPSGAGARREQVDDEMTVMQTRAEVLVVVDFETVTTGRHPGSRVESGLPGVALPTETIRRMTCLADIVPVLLDSAGVVVTLGRTVRLANRAQRRALRAMHETCAVPDCPVAFRHCQPHHIAWFRRGGCTDLDNLVPLCSRHHHAVHEGGWTIHLDPATRVLSVTLPGEPGAQAGAEPP